MNFSCLAKVEIPRIVAKSVNNEITIFPHNFLSSHSSAASSGAGFYIIFF
jgi:hypothetical protein